MVIDTSAVLAILNLEPEAERFAEIVQSRSVRLMSAGTALEMSIVVRARKKEVGMRELDFWLYKASIEVVSFDPLQLEVARQAFSRFGKGHHPACLNFGDCFAYALSKTSGHPLLFKGKDFAQTDVLRVEQT